MRFFQVETKIDFFFQLAYKTVGFNSNSRAKRASQRPAPQSHSSFSLSFQTFRLKRPIRPKQKYGCFAVYKQRAEKNLVSVPLFSTLIIVGGFSENARLKMP